MQYNAVLYLLYCVASRDFIHESSFWQFLCHISDINECVQTPAPCHALANCIDTEGSFTCTCKTGYTGDGISFCVGKKLKWI